MFFVSALNYYLFCPNVHMECHWNAYWLSIPARALTWPMLRGPCWSREESRRAAGAWWLKHAAQNTPCAAPGKTAGEEPRSEQSVWRNAPSQSWSEARIGSLRLLTFWQRHIEVSAFLFSKENVAWCHVPRCIVNIYIDKAARFRTVLNLDFDFVCVKAHRTQMRNRQGTCSISLPLCAKPVSLSCRFRCSFSQRVNCLLCFLAVLVEGRSLSLPCQLLARFEGWAGSPLPWEG